MAKIDFQPPGRKYNSLYLLFQVFKMLETTFKVG